MSNTVKFTKENNGHILTIEIPKDDLLTDIDNEIKCVETAKATDTADENEFYDFGMNKVYSDIDEFCTFDEILNDLNGFKNDIQKIINDDGESLWNMCVFKKNGTFKKSCKPLIREAINGDYWDDSYGWNTRVLRLIPKSDTLARVEFDHIVVHY